MNMRCSKWIVPSVFACAAASAFANDVAPAFQTQHCHERSIAVITPESVSVAPDWSFGAGRIVLHESPGIASAEQVSRPEIASLSNRRP
jgi:hypothetical protein